MEEVVPVEGSRAIEYLQQKGWSFSVNGQQQAVLDCPICSKPGHFYMNTTNGCWDCKVCGRTGNIKTLRMELGDPIPGVVSMNDATHTAAAQKPLPDVEATHRALLDNDDAMLYLLNERGWSQEAIAKMKLGLGTFSGKDWLLFHYVNGGKHVYTKARTLPPNKKEFHGSTGRENPLFNADAIHPDAEYLILVEGEGDCMAVLSLGEKNVVGVPGANMKKAAWLDRLDVWWEARNGKSRQVYVLYDNDKVGQEAAEEITKRIGIERVLLCTIPKFTKGDGTDGKDINEWTTTPAAWQSKGAENVQAAFAELLKSARPLEIKGVMDIGSALDSLEDDINRRGTASAPLGSPWASVNEVLGGVEYGDVIGIIAEGKVGKTTFALDWADWFVDVKKIPTLFLCFEMPQRRVARKWVSFVTRTPDDQMSVEAIQRARDILSMREADFVLGYTSAQDQEKVFDLIRSCVRRYGIKVLVLDNLQLMVREVQHAAQATSVLSKRIKDLAMELGILILLIVQPKRVEANEIVAARHSAGSSAIEKDLDCMICLHRGRVGVIKASDFQGFVEERENFSPYLLARVDLSRYSSGGATTLYMEGSMSLIREMTPGEAKDGQETVPAISSEVPIEGRSSGAEGF